MVDVSICATCGTPLSKSRLDREFGGICPHCLGALLSREEPASAAGPKSPGPPSDLRQSPLGIGDRFRSYEIQEAVARGGMGFVYRAVDLELGRTVALKILSPELAASDAFRLRFNREAKILATLNHPNIVQVFDFGQEADLLFLVMEDVPGQDLQMTFDSGRPLDRERFLTILRDVARGLECIHQAGLVHRDIKPANILISPGGAAKIGDFGIVLEARDSERLTQTGTFIGTPHYVSPEHVQGKAVDGRSDLYSLGIILYQGVVGRTPFSAPNPSALLLKHVQEPVPAAWKAIPDLPPLLGELLRKLLEKDPAQRPSSAQALGVLLDRILQSPGPEEGIRHRTPLPPGGPLHRTPRARSSANPLLGESVAGKRQVAVGLVATLALLLGFLLWGSDRSREGKDTSPPPAVTSLGLDVPAGDLSPLPRPRSERRPRLRPGF